VIILQSDHGHGRFGGTPPPVAKANGEQVQERFDVFAAYAGPIGIADSLAVNRTPVNLFRSLFRVLWNTEEMPLSDRHFWSNPDQPLALTNVALD
jgi:hypothetical protein